MSSHNTNQKPSILKRLLKFVGLLDLPTRVNCWFCNQDSFLLPGSKDTVDHWVCHLCENTNARDRNGEILDPSPFQTAPASRASTIPRSIKSNSRSICDNCIQNQALIYDILSKYIPDESDPEYEYRYANRENESARLHNKYRICEPCQALVDMVVAEKMEFLSIRSINRSLSSSMDEIQVPKRPLKSSYFYKRIIWILIHSCTILFVIHEILYPSVWNITNLMDGFHQFYTHLKSINYYNLNYDDLYNSAFDIINHACIRSTATLTILFILLNLISLKTLEYHPRVDRLQHEKVKSWKQYKSLQITLLFVRLILIMMTYAQVSNVILCIVITIYISVLIMSLCTVKVQGAAVRKEIGIMTQSSIIEQTPPTANDDDDVSMMDISYMDEPLSIENQVDPLDEMISRMQAL